MSARLLRRARGRSARCLLVSLLTAGLTLYAAVRRADGQQAEPARPQTVPAAQLQQAIAHLGDLDDATRIEAGRTIRRTAADEAVPALVQAVLKSPDEYVRYKALVLLTGFGGAPARDTVGRVLADRNDRLRLVAYRYFEHHPDPAIVVALLAALDRERAPFVRPALIRALAANDSGADVQHLLVQAIGEGQTFSRSAVIEALGDAEATYAVDPLITIAKADGPLRDDAILALGSMHDARVLPALVAVQQKAPQNTQPALAAAFCLQGLHGDSHLAYLSETLAFSIRTYGYQQLVRATARSLGVVASRGTAQALTILIDAGVPARQPARAPIALALARVALRNTPLVLAALEGSPQQAQAVALLAEAFDMIEDDYEKERFFVVVRHAYWAAPDGSPRRKLMAALIGAMRF